MDQATLAQPIEVAESHTPEWYAARKTGFGGSDAAAVAGLSEYKTPRDVYHEKRGEIDPPEETDAMRLGTLLEPVIRSEFIHKTGIQLLHAPMPMYRSSEHEFMLGTPDGFCDDSAILEAKSTNWRRAQSLGLSEDNQLPEECADWICQCQHYMAVLQVTLCHVAVLVDGRTLKTFDVPRNDRLIKGLIAAEAELWERIQNSDPPEINWEHSRALELAKELFDTVADGMRVELSEAAADSWARYEMYGAEIRDLEKARKAEKAKVMMELGDNFAGVLPDGERMIRRKRIVSEVKASTRDYVDVRAVKFDGGIIAEAIDSDTLTKRYMEADRLLKAAGFLRHERSEYGSCYYIHSKDSRRVRVSDHAANKATRAWMERAECKEIRIDRKTTDVAGAIEQLTTNESEA